MAKYAKALAAFLNASHSNFHAVENLRTALEEQGYARLTQEMEWKLQPGGKYYTTRNGSAILAFRVPEGEIRGFLMSASHSDRPTFQIKENAEQPSGAYLRLAVEKYGGMILSTWLDRPLSVAGRVLVRTGSGIESRLVDLDRDLCLIPNVAIHMNRKVNEGYAWNPAVDLLPLVGPAAKKGWFLDTVAEAAGAAPQDILGTDLTLYVRQPASLWGPEEDYISSQALDDLQCAFGTMQGFLAAGTGASVPLCCVFDNEEVGSNTMQGADSDFLKDALQRICAALGLDLSRELGRSLMVSADNAHAVHPNHPEYVDPGNGPVINGGIVLKFNANRRYTTDGVTAALFREVCARAEVPVQTYYNRADLPGGSTLGNISTAQVSVPTVDIGLAQLAMHSAYETAGTRDTDHLVEAMAVYFGLNLRREGNLLRLESCKK